MESSQSIAREPLINNRYRVLRPLGAGAMGTVQLVADTLDDNQPVALKTLRGDAVSSYGYAAFKNEFQAMTTFHHPNVVEVYEFGTLEQTQGDFFTMEFVEGKNLIEASKAADLETIYQCATQIGRALEYIHAQGFIHFDLKPDNLMVRQDGTVKVMDFGLVEQASFGQSQILKGTVHYLAPEMLRGDQVDCRLDLYSLGAVLFHVITGRTLFEGTLEHVMYQHLHDAPDLARGPRRPVPEPLRPVLLRLLEKDPAKRPGSAGEFLLELARVCGRERGLPGRDVTEIHVLGSRSVGRDAELMRLKELFRQRVLEPGPEVPAAALVTGPSGAGKSRLLQELRHHTQLRRVHFYQGACLQNGGQPYLPFAEILRALARDILPEAAPPGGSEGGPASESSQSSALPHEVARPPPATGSEATFKRRPEPPSPESGAAPSEALAFGKPPIAAERDRAGHTLAYGTGAPAPELATIIDLSTTSGSGTVAFGVGSSGLANLTEALNKTPSAAEPSRPREAAVSLNRALRENAAALSRVLGEDEALSGLSKEAPKFSSPEREKAWVLESVSQFFLAVSRVRPLVLYCADLHWADQLTIEMFGKLTRALAAAGAEASPPRMMICGCYRAEEIAGSALEKLSPELEKEGAAARVELRPLSAADVAAMLSSMLGPVDSVDSVAELLAERTGGNPFFIEASIRSLLEEGAIDHRGPAWAFSPAALREALIPGTVDGVLDRMLGRLSPREQEAMQLLAVINRPVNLPVLNEAGESDEKAMRELLSSLRKKRFVARGWGDGHHQYSLRHSVLREHVYQSIAPPRRIHLHGAAGLALERRYGDGDRYLEDLAQHFQRSGNLEKTIHYARAAGDRAKRLYDLKRAATLYQQAYETHRLLGADLAISIAEASIYAASEKHVERLKLALPVIEEAQDTGRLAKLQNSMGRMYYALGRQRDAIQWFTQFMKATEGTQDDFARALPHAVLGRASFFMGQFEAARMHLERSVPLLRARVGSEEDVSHALGMCGVSYGFLGQLHQGRTLIEESLTLASAINHSTRLALGRIYMGCILCHFGRWPEAREWLDRGLEDSHRTGDVIAIGTGSSFRGTVALAEGDAARAVELCRYGRDHIAKAGGTWTFTVIGAQLAEAYIALGDLASAQKSISDTLPLLETGERWGESCLYLAQGRIHACRREWPDAKHWFAKSLAVANAQSGRPFEAKARLALGACLRDEGEQRLAVEELSESRKLFDELKMGWYRDRAEALLEGASVGPCP